MLTPSPEWRLGLAQPVSAWLVKKKIGSCVCYSTGQSPEAGSMLCGRIWLTSCPQGLRTSWDLAAAWVAVIEVHLVWDWCFVQLPTWLQTLMPRTWAAYLWVLNFFKKIFPCLGYLLGPFCPTRDWKLENLVCSAPKTRNYWKIVPFVWDIF